MSAHAHFWLRTLIIGSAIVGAFVLGAVFGHLKPWQRHPSVREKDNTVAWMLLPKVLDKCIMSSVEATSNQNDRRTYIIACMENKGYEPALKEHSCNYLVSTYNPESPECWVAP